MSDIQEILLVHLTHSNEIISSVKVNGEEDYAPQIQMWGKVLSNVAKEVVNQMTPNNNESVRDTLTDDLLKSFEKHMDSDSNRIPVVGKH